MKRVLYAGVAALLVLAALFPAPLEPGADSTRPPNPAKSAWFLLWTQELLSYDTLTIYLVLALAVLLVALPWLRPPAEHAAWFQRSQRAVWIGTILVFLFVVGLTIVAFFFRGSDWCLVAPF